MSEQVAFVTGGSGFIGGRLIRGCVGEGWTRPRAGALRRVGRQGRGARRRAGRAATSTTSTAMRAGAERLRVAFHAAAHARRLGPREEFERGNVDGHAQRARGLRATAGVRRFVHVGTEAALLAGRAARERRRGRAAAARLAGRSTRPPRRWPSRRCATPTATASRRSSCARASCGARATRRPAPARDAPSRAGASPGSAAAATSPSTTHVDNVVEGLCWARRAGAPGERLLRHRRRAGRVPRVRLRAARRPRASSRPDRSSRRRSRALVARRRRGRLEGAARCPGTPPLTRLAVLALGAGVHDRHLTRPRGARLRAGADDRGGDGGAARGKRGAAGGLRSQVSGLRSQVSGLRSRPVQVPGAFSADRRLPTLTQRFFEALAPGCVARLPAELALGLCRSTRRAGRSTSLHELAGGQSAEP